MCLFGVMGICVIVFVCICSLYFLFFFVRFILLCCCLMANKDVQKENRQYNATTLHQNNNAVAVSLFATGRLPKKI